MYTVATQRYTAPTRSDTDHFHPCTPGRKIAQVYFFPRTCRCTKDHTGCLPGVYTDDVGDNTDHQIKIRDDPGCDP